MVRKKAGSARGVADRLEEPGQPGQEVKPSMAPGGVGGLVNTAISQRYESGFGSLKNFFIGGRLWSHLYS